MMSTEVKLFCNDYNYIRQILVMASVQEAGKILKSVYTTLNSQSSHQLKQMVISVKVVFVQNFSAI